jgi:hypothetical protein
VYLIGTWEGHQNKKIMKPLKNHVTEGTLTTELAERSTCVVAVDIDGLANKS